MEYWPFHSHFLHISFNSFTPKTPPPEVAVVVVVVVQLEIMLILLWWWWWLWYLWPRNTLVKPLFFWVVCWNCKRTSPTEWERGAVTPTPILSFSNSLCPFLTDEGSIYIKTSFHFFSFFSFFFFGLSLDCSNCFCRQWNWKPKPRSYGLWMGQPWRVG